MDAYQGKGVRITFLLPLWISLFPPPLSLAVTCIYFPLRSLEIAQAGHRLEVLLLQAPKFGISDLYHCARFSLTSEGFSQPWVPFARPEQVEERVLI